MKIWSFHSINGTVPGIKQKKILTPWGHLFTETTIASIRLQNPFWPIYFKSDFPAYPPAEKSLHYLRNLLQTTHPLESI
jgi:hypothetical protein